MASMRGSIPTSARSRCRWRRDSSMRIRPVIVALLGLAFTHGLVACNDLLEVDNNDTPDVASTLATPTGILAITASLYQTIWNTNNGSIGGGQPNPIYPHLLNMSFESHMQIAQPPSLRGSLPRGPISNARNDVGAPDNFRDFSGLSKNSRTSSNVIIAINGYLATGRTLGAPGVTARSKAFAFFANGVSL